MKTIVPQITLRNIPEPVNRYLRSQAKKTGKSLNQVIISELSEQAGITKNGKPQSITESLGWFIGSGMDQDVVDALEKEDNVQKQLAARELDRFNDVSGL